MCSLLAALARLSMASVVGVIVIGCGDGKPASSTATFDVAALPGLGATHQEMLDLVFAAQAAAQRISPSTAPWTWFNDYTIMSCAKPVIGHGATMSLPDLGSSALPTTAERPQVFAAVEVVAGLAGLSTSWSPDVEGEFRLVEFSSGDGRTLRMIADDYLVLTATISCISTDGLVVDANGSLPMPANP